MDKSCVYTGLDKSASDRFSYLVQNGFTCKGDPVWNCTVPRWYRACSNATQFMQTRARLDPIQMDWNCTDLVQMQPERSTSTHSFGSFPGRGEGTSIYRGDGDVPLIRVYFLESFSQTGCLFWGFFAILLQQAVHWEISLQNKVYF